MFQSFVVAFVLERVFVGPINNVWMKKGKKYDSL